MQLFFLDRSLVWKVGTVAGLEAGDVAGLFERRRLPQGTPVLMDGAMRPVEPLCSWFRDLALAGRSARTMRTYAYSALMLLGFLGERGLDLCSAGEVDISEFRVWRRADAAAPVAESTWDKDAAAISNLYQWLVQRGDLVRVPWRPTRRGSPLTRGYSQDLRVRHLTLEQYAFFRDVGLGGLTPSGQVDEGFAGTLPHRGRAACELALMTGMRIGEWSTLLLPELGLLGGVRPEYVDVDLAACAKSARPRSVYVPPGAMEMLDPYLLIERPQLVAGARRALKDRRCELFVVDRIGDGGRVSGMVRGERVTRALKDLGPDMRRIAVTDTGAGLEPLALFVGRGGRMLSASGWDRVRWRAWARMREWAGRGRVPPMPRSCWLYHDLRHTFALRLLIYLTRQGLAEAGDGRLPFSSVLEHMACNPLLVVQRRLGHAQPSTTYRYVRYLKDPMREVDDALREWSAAEGATYAAIARRALELEEPPHATQR